MSIYLMVRDHRAHTHALEVGWRLEIDYNYEVEGDLMWAYVATEAALVEWAHRIAWKDRMPDGVIDIRGVVGDNPFLAIPALARVPYFLSQYPATAFLDQSIHPENFDAAGRWRAPEVRESGIRLQLHNDSRQSVIERLREMYVNKLGRSKLDVMWEEDNGDT